MTATTTTPRDLASLVGDDVADAAHLARHRVQRLLISAQSASRIQQPERLRLAARSVAVEYRTALHGIRESASTRRLTALRGTLQQRLCEGYRLAPTVKRDVLWSRLLAEFEIVSDALAADCMARYADRLDDLRRMP